MFININTKQIFTEQEIKNQFPNISFPIPFKPPEGFELIFKSPQPSFNPETEFISEGVAEKIGDKWYQSWNRNLRSQEEMDAMREVASIHIQNEIVEYTQKRLDDFAKTRGYDGILSLTTYSNSSILKFRIEGLYGIEIRDQTWNTLYQILENVKNNLRAIPKSYSEIEAELPELIWPN